ncbi:MAG TPA: hypothetical protein PK514_02195 [Spirochaetota bacterium]|nr:hypothetical protein [Spirochaetota bacterium]
MKLMIKYITLAALLILSAAIVTCKSRTVEEHSYGDECKHCHGEQLQGIQNIKAYCGECHDPLKMSMDQIQVQERKDAILNGAHVHKTDNIFKSTPSCFYCHRRTDF